MRYLAIICLLLFVAFSVNSQDIVLKRGMTSVHYVGKSTDVIDAAENLDKVILIDKDYWYNYNITVDIDTNTDATDQTVSCILAGSDDNVNYTTITDVTFGVTQDTIIYYSNAVVATEAQSIAQHTRTTAAHVILDTTTAYDIWAMDSIIYDDTLHVPAISLERNVPAQTQTVAAQTITNTITAGGKMWHYLRVRLTGDAAASAVELQAIRVKIARVPTK